MSKVMTWVFLPIKKNGAFFFFMYVLGIVSSLLVLPDRPNAHLYENIWQELFLDMYAICLILAIVPKRVRKWIRGLFYFAAYATTIADVFCFVKFQSTLNPTMLLLAGETNGREAGEFLGSYLSMDVVLSGVGVILLLMLVHIASSLSPMLLERFPGNILTRNKETFSQMWKYAEPALGTITVVLLTYSITTSAHNKREMAEMFSKQSIGGVEHELTTEGCAQFYLPLYRLAFSLFSNGLASEQIAKLLVAKEHVSVDSCTFRSPTIVLIIGESYNKYHSQLYGYDKPTSPRQLERMKNDRLVAFNDVVAPWNLTSFVFKYMFSTYVVGGEGEWCDYPLFPEIFRKAGYHVTFITNQFLPKAKEAVYDFSGGFFLNDPELSKAQFDTRNGSVHTFDDGILRDYDELKRNNAAHNLIIFHVMGQHVSYNARYPRSRRKFYGTDYDRPDLGTRDKDILSHYDNATLYNDSIVDQIIHRFEDDNAVVIYLSDHGEECFDDGFKHYGRNHSAEITPRLAHQEFDVPFWIWCSHEYAVTHPDVLSGIIETKDRRMMTDALPHLLLYLAGISTKDYKEDCNILSPKYDEKRPRIIKAKVDYDKLMEEHHGK